MRPKWHSASVRANRATTAASVVRLDRGLRPQRVLLSGVLLFLVLSPTADEGALGPDALLGLGIIAAVNLLWNAAFTFIDDPLEDRDWTGAAQIAIDAVLALGAISLVDAQSTPLAWMLLLVPVLDAASKYGMRGAIGAWAGLSLVYLVIVLSTETDGSPTSDVVNIGLQQLAAVIGVAVPVSIMSSQFRQRLDDADRARSIADQHKHHLSGISHAVHTMSRSRRPSDVLDAALTAAVRLGFDRVDVAELRSESWRLVHSAGSPWSLEPDNDPLITRALDGGGLAHAGVGESLAEDRQRLHHLGYVSQVVLIGRVNDRQLFAMRGFSFSAISADAVAIDSLRTLMQHTLASVENINVQVALEQWSAELDHRANHDVLTGLPNRSYLMEALEEPEPGTATLFLDLDGFKGINDTHGHEAGDLVLQTMADRLAPLVDGSGFVVRLGGDEFVIVSHGRDRDALEALAKRTIATIVQPIDLGRVVVRTGASVGVAMWAGDDIHGMLRRSDTAMYSAKIIGRRSGTPTYRFDSTSPHPTVSAPESTAAPDEPIRSASTPAPKAS